MNPLKCAFGVTLGKFLGFVVWKEGIEINPNGTKENCRVYKKGWLI